MGKNRERRESLVYHAKPKPGKIEVVPTKKYNSQRDLAIAYSPGVAIPCQEIEKDPDNVYKYTNKSNLVAVITNGTAVLGLGDIGPDAVNKNIRFPPVWKSRYNSHKLVTAKTAHKIGFSKKGFKTLAHGSNHRISD